MENNYENVPKVVVEERRRMNVFGLIGFIFSLLTLFSSWVPVAGWVLWVLGFVFSLIGLFRAPRGLAVSGFIISVVVLLILICFAGLVMTFFSAILAYCASVINSIFC